MAELSRPDREIFRKKIRPKLGEKIAGFLKPDTRFFAIRVRKTPEGWKIRLSVDNTRSVSRIER